MSPSRNINSRHYVQLFLSDEENHADRNENYDKGHGRLEQRTSVVNNEIDWLQNGHQWPGLKSIGMVSTSETRFYISSLELSAQQLNDVARKHWGIENQLHWRLDVVFNEDKACIRNDNAAENMGIMRKWALNAIKTVREKPDQSLSGIMRKNSMSFKHLILNVGKIFHA